MSRRKRKQKARRRPSGTLGTERPSPPRKRRPPLPRLDPPPSESACPPVPSDTTPQIVTDIVDNLHRVCDVACLDPVTTLTDWLGMLEPALRFYPDNALSLVTTGHFIEDPPEVKEHYRRARERYLRASERYPAAYRQMQEAFALTSALLQAAGEPGLMAYAPQTAVNPDIIGQVFLAVARPDPSWWSYFPAWNSALAQAEILIPNGAEAVMQVLLRGHLAYQEAVSDPILKPAPGPQFEQWYAQVLPFCEPLIFGPQMATSSASMLAMATRFPPWAIASNLVTFYPRTAHPLLEQMNQINTYLYGLNGYDLRLAQAALEILEYRRQHPLPSEPPPADEPEASQEEDEVQPALSDLTSPDIVEDVLRQGAASAHRIRPPGTERQATFADLFRRKS